MYNKFEEQLKSILSEEQIKKNEVLANHTTFRMGGPADFFLTPGNEREVSELLKLCNACEIPYYVLGNGSNILAGDQGFRGVILQIGKGMDFIDFEEEVDGRVRVRAGAGVLLSKLAKAAAKLSLTGFEFAAGIPGYLGGAVAMNAGAYGGEIKDSICQAKVITTEGKCITLSQKELELGYRSSIVQREQYIVTEATFVLQKGTEQEILDTMADFQMRRKEKQPLEFPSAGSTFKRPEGYFAGKLFEDAGLKGYRVGDIMVSEKHCGFVVNVGQGTAADTYQLIQDVKNKVYEQFQVELEPEVRIIGEGF